MIRCVLSASDGAPGRSQGWTLTADTLLVILEDGTARLIDLAGDLYALDATAAKMVEETLRCGADSAARTLADEFGADTGAIRADLDALLHTLEERAFLHWRQGRPDRRRRVRERGARALVPLLAATTRPPLRSLRARAWVLLTLAYTSTRLFGWSSTVRAWTAPWRPAAGGNEEESQSADVERALDAIGAAVRYVAARHPLNMECKERALGSWALTRAERLPARVVLGISLFPLSLHAWAESGSRIITDRYDGYCDRYTPLVSYGCPGAGLVAGT